MEERPGACAEAVDAALQRLADERAVERIHARDHTLWRPDPDEIADRLGWLEAPAGPAGGLEPAERLVVEARADGLTRVALIGMGGSSLAPEVFAEVFGGRGMELEVLDSTDPAAVAAAEARLDPASTLWIVSSKSGTTVETLSLFKRFHRVAVESLGEAAAAKRFVAITDPGSRLAEMADAIGFRAVFLADPDVGGRYSALTWFGLVPAALVGVDLPRLLERAAAAAEACREPDPRANPGARLGAIVGAMALEGRDKLTLLLPPRLHAFGAWIEQLVAESTGKEGRGVLPVVETSVGDPEALGDDRLFVRLRLADGEPAPQADAIAAAGHPVVELDLADPYDLAAWFYLWEFATAVAGHVIDVQPFDQPNVESAKRRAGEMLEAFRERGALPEPEPALVDGADRVYGDVGADSLAGALSGFLERAAPPDYVAVLAWLPPEPETTAAMERLRVRISAARGIAATAAYGPRYLHSTGQLHKGDAGRGRFLVLTADSPEDVPIPDSPGTEASGVGFRALERAQALGDVAALEEAGRRVLRIHMEEPGAAGIDRVRNLLPPIRLP